MIRDYTRKYYLEQNCNCAETVFLAANEALNLGLSMEDSRLICAFGGGMGCGSVCGALAGAMAILGRYMVKDRAHTTEGFKESCAALKAAFEARLGSIFCEDIKKRNFNEQERCLLTVELAADVLEAHLNALEGKAEEPLTADEIKRVKGLGSCIRRAPESSTAASSPATARSQRRRAAA